MGRSLIGRVFDPSQPCGQKWARNDVQNEIIAVNSAEETAYGVSAMLKVNTKRRS